MLGESSYACEIRAVENEICEVSSQINVLEKRKEELLLKKKSLQESLANEKTQNLLQFNWASSEFKWSHNVNEKLKNVFGLDTFRSHQLEAINATMSNIDTILIMPTGGGKSLCYQLPALISKGVTLVVSPLISLMEDQLMGLEKLGICARMLSASSTKEEVKFIYDTLVDMNSELKLMYVTPEKLSKSKRLMSKLQKVYQLERLSRIAIDEVHCCSQWGHDFRPDYKFLGIMKQMFPKTPILGLTATATSKVVADVQKMLRIPGCLVFRASYNRPNLYYEVLPKPTTLNECADALKRLLTGEFNNCSGIIYTTTIRDSEELATELVKRGVRVAPYHANLEAKARSKIHLKWMKNVYQAVIATIAFGMGIDKPDVRFVIHHCLSKSMENYYQESGRAGRDGKEAKCLLFWKFNDFIRQSTMVFTEQTGLENLYSMIYYCLDVKRCRRKLIAEHFSERWDSDQCNKMCDHCASSVSVSQMDLKEYGSHLLQILENASRLEQRLTGTKLIDAWLGKGPGILRIKDATARGLVRDAAENIVAHLLVDGFLTEDFHFTPYNTISYIVPGPKAKAGCSPSSMEVALKTSRKRLCLSSGKDSEIVKNDIDTITAKDSADVEEPVTGRGDRKRVKVYTIEDSDNESS